jgi:hypothetical protein
MISTILNRNATNTIWKSTIQKDCEVALVGKETLIKTSTGFVPVSSLGSLPFGKVVDRFGKEQAILGIVHAEVEGATETNQKWNTGHYEDRHGIWIKGISSVKPGSTTIQGMAFITKTGEYILWDEIQQKEIIVRDFTEIGYDAIHETYPFVEARLRTIE